MGPRCSRTFSKPSPGACLCVIPCFFYVRSPCFARVCSRWYSVFRSFVIFRLFSKCPQKSFFCRFESSLRAGVCIMCCMLCTISGVQLLCKRLYEYSSILGERGFYANGYMMTLVETKDLQERMFHECMDRVFEGSHASCVCMYTCVRVVQHPLHCSQFSDVLLSLDLWPQIDVWCPGGCIPIALLPRVRYSLSLWTDTMSQVRSSKMPTRHRSTPWRRSRPQTAKMAETPAALRILSLAPSRVSSPILHTETEPGAC